jgi:hypothetical protein
MFSTTKPHNYEASVSSISVSEDHLHRLALDETTVLPQARLLVPP